MFLGVASSVVGRLMTSAASQFYAIAGKTPQLVLDFLREAYRVDGAAATFDSALTFVRASSATMVDSTGMLITVPSGTPRLGHHVYNGSEWVNEGLLFESEARTNLVTYSEASTANWAATFATTTQLSENYLGTFAGVRVASLGANWNRFDSPTIAWASGQTYSITLVYVAGTSGRVLLNVRDGGAGTESRIRGVVGAIAVEATNAGALTNLATEVLPGGVYMTTFTFVPNSTTVGGRVSIGPDSTTIGQDIIVLGAQLEAGSTPSSYIPTAGATVTRAAETLVIPSANLPWSSTAVSIAMDGRVTGNTMTTTRWYNSSTAYITQSIGAASLSFAQYGDGALDTVTGGSFSTGINVPFNIASRHGSTFINGAVDGVALTADLTPVALPDLSATDLQLGYTFMGVISKFRVWSDDLGDAGIAEASA